jgi:glycine oxidase
VTLTIVGAGIVGCAVAYECAARGASVTVIDARGVGRGATHASAGILAPAIEGHSPSLLRLTRSSLLLFDRFVSRVRATSAIDVEYERRGTLQVAIDASEAEGLSRASARLREAGVEHLFADGPEARKLEPALSPTVAAALLVPEHGYVAVEALTEALRDGAARQGAAFVPGRVDAVERGSAGPRLVLGTQIVDCDAAIIAAGSWSSDLMSGAITPAPVTPVRGQLLRVRPDERVASRVVWGSRCYLVPWRSGELLVGATVEDVGFDERATVAGVHSLLTAAIELIPRVAGATFEEVRVGFRPKTRDELPIMGRSSHVPGLFHATGHYRNGVLLAPLTATLMADLVLDGREAPELALTQPKRFGL